MNQSKLEGKFLYANLAIAIFMDVIVPLPIIVAYALGVTAPAGFGVGFVLNIFATIATILFRWLHSSIEVDRYTKEKRAQIRALRQEASVWDRTVSGLARQVKDVEVFFQQQVDRIAGFFIRSLVRKILRTIFESLPFLSKIIPGYLVTAVYDLVELRKERQSFESVETEIEKLKQQVDNGAQIARKAKQEANEEERKNRARKLAGEASQKKKGKKGRSRTSSQSSSGGGRRTSQSKRGART